MYSEGIKATRKALTDLHQALPAGSILFPHSKAYEESVFIGNSLYRWNSPAAVVQAVNEADVQETVKFAAQQNIQLSVRSGAHGFGGFCLNQGGIVLDIRSLNQVEVRPDGKEISIGGGALWGDVYRTLHANSNKRLAITGAHGATVGVGGFLLGGGVSTFSRSYGMGADNILELTIVTADGSLVTLNKESLEKDTTEEGQRKRDLFWALQGGGGGNFGVVTHFQVKLYEFEDLEGTVVTGELTWYLDENDQESQFQSMMTKWNETSWPSQLSGDVLWVNEQGKRSAKLGIFYNGNMQKCNEAIRPLLEFSPTSTLKEEVLMQYNEYSDEPFTTSSRVFSHNTSAVLAEGQMTPDLTKYLTGWAKEVTNSGGEPFVFCNHLGYATKEKNGQKIDNNATPFPWREAEFICLLRASWSHTKQSDKMFDLVAQGKTELNKYALHGKAAYVNYLDKSLENWREAYFGDNYPKLQQVKSAWDPDNVFRFAMGIERSGKDLNMPIDPNPAKNATIPESFDLSKKALTDEVFAYISKARKQVVPDLGALQKKDRTVCVGC
ncbi:hypothetical protein BDV25DRAFT_137436 [Aspergillus avenaceus]|uniref:FAD-binding PCMH-type domain-containing protein n=1 Tax=Aspergillus avenaceus TaxID=36643 RepID=A0A5N6U2I1_ASPAV|nr:hypothetical protein BDV25DRAFT_137436 [Aspergillus avenaceus]